MKTRVRGRLALAAAWALFACGPRQGAPYASGPQSARRTPVAGYPQRFALLSQEGRDAREAEFRKRNPAAWTDVRIDSVGGFVLRASSSDPLVVGGCAPFEERQKAHWREFLTRNAEFFGLSPAQADGLMIKSRTDGANDLVLVQKIDGQIQALVSISKNNGDHGACERFPTLTISGHLWGPEPVPAARPITDDQPRELLRGGKYDVTLRYAMPGQRDCHPACEPSPDLVVNRRVVLSKQDVSISHGLLMTKTSDPDEVELRYVIVAEPSFAFPLMDMRRKPASLGRLPWEQGTVAPVDGARCMRLVLDAVDGGPIEESAISAERPEFGPPAHAQNVCRVR